MNIKENIRIVLAAVAIPVMAVAQGLSQKQNPVNRGSPLPIHGGSITGSSITNVDTIIPVSSLNGSNTVAGSTNLSVSAFPQFMESDGEKYRLISFAQLASFIFASNADADSIAMSEQVPASVRALNEKSVALTGFMLPVQAENNLTTDFLLLRNQSACCYGVMPKINEWVIVRTTGKGVKTIMDTPVTVLGTFHVGAVSENGTLSGIYKLDCDKIINPKN
jgi:hypothetical protein